MLQTGETELGKWPLKYFPPNGGKYFGTITITNFRLMFLQKKQLNKESNFEFSLSKSEISSVSIQKKFLKHNVIISVKGKNHSFSKLFFNTRNFIKFLKM